MPPFLPPPLFSSLLFLLLLLTPTPGSTAHAQTSRRLLQSTLPPPPPPPPPHHHHHHTPRSPPPSPPQLTPPPPQLNPVPPTPTPPTQTPPASLPPASAPPPTPTPTLPPPTPTSKPTPDAYPFTNYPFFPSASPPPPLAEQQSQPSGGGDASRTFPANISNLVAPNSSAPSGSPRRFPLFQALLLAFLSFFLLLLSVLLSIHLFRRLRSVHPHHAANGPTSSHSASSSARRDDDDDDGEEGDEEGRSLKPPPMPTSSTNPSTEFLYLGTLASSATPSTHIRPGSPELRPLPPLPRTGPPSREFFASRSSPRAGANPSSASSSSLSPSSPSASSPTLGSSPAHFHARPPSIPQPRGRAPNPSPPKRRPSPPPPPPPHQSWNPFAPASPPPRAPPSDDDDGAESYTTDMRKSRPLHSDKLKPGSLHMKDEMIQLYLNNSAPREVCLLGARRCHGIGMVLGALGVSEERVRDALLEGNAHGLGVEALRMLIQVVLNNEEELKLRYFKDDPAAKLCKVDAFLKTILDVPFAFKRVDAMLYVSNFYLEVNQLRMYYATLEAACQELRSSRLFHRVLGAVLNFGNLMSINTGSPNSHALEPNTLLKIVDVKGADGKAALLNFVVQEIVKPEGHNSLNTMHSGSTSRKMNAGTLPYDVNYRKHGLQIVSTLASELTCTKKAATIDITSLSRTLLELGSGLGKIHNVLRLNSMIASAESARRFHGAMGTFLREAEEEILKLQAQESVCLSSVKEMAEYFHGDDSASGDEARMSRIFAGVREFVAMLDRICRGAGEINGDCVGSTTMSWMAAAPMGMTTATP